MSRTENRECPAVPCGLPGGGCPYRASSNSPRPGPALTRGPAGLQTLLLRSKVVLVPLAAAVDKELAVPGAGVVEEPRDPGFAGPNVGAELAEVWGCRAERRECRGRDSMRLSRGLSLSVSGTAPCPAVTAKHGRASGLSLLPQGAELNALQAPSAASACRAGRCALRVLPCPLGPSF